MSDIVANEELFTDNNQKKIKSKDESIKKKINIIQKESALTAIYASGNLTASQKKVFNAFLYLGKEIVNSTATSAEDGFVVPVSVLKRLIGDNTNNYTYLKKTVESLQNFTVESNVLGKDKSTKWDRFSLVAGATIDGGSLRFSFPHQIIEALKNPKMYVTLDLDEINRIDRKYAISLYEIVEDYKKLPSLPKWTIAEFKKALDIHPSSYKTFRDLHRRVIEPAVNEINDKFGMGLEYILYSNLLTISSNELLKNGVNALENRLRMPRITHIQFRLIKENMQERISYKNFVENMRKKYMPNPNEGIFPVIDIIEDKIFKVDIMGRLYIQRVDSNGVIEIQELSPEESDGFWKMLWKKSLNKEIQ